MSLQTILAQIIKDASEQLVEEFAEATREVQETPRDWEAFQGRVTVRKNPLAPMTIVEEYRDNIDTRLALDNTDADIPNMQVKVNVPYAADLYEDKPLFEEMLNEHSVKDLWEAALKKTL
jgi:hypothetical protein